jgi:hypothetical protein
MLLHDTPARPTQPSLEAGPSRTAGDHRRFLRAVVLGADFFAVVFFAVVLGADFFAVVFFARPVDAVRDAFDAFATSLVRQAHQARTILSRSDFAAFASATVASFRTRLVPPVPSRRR